MDDAAATFVSTGRCHSLAVPRTEEWDEEEVCSGMRRDLWGSGVADDDETTLE